MVRAVVSHLGLGGLSMLGSVLVKTTFQETVVLALTFTVVLVVLTVVGEEAPVRVIVGSVYNAVPVQSLLGYSVKFTVPVRAEPPADVTVAESFGSQSWAVVMDDVSFTLKHSLFPVPLSLAPPG